MSTPHFTEQPCAAAGLISYRYRGTFGYIMIGAKDDADALREAARSANAPIVRERLEVWNSETKSYAAPAYHSGFNAGRSDWVGATVSEYAMACRNESAETFSGQYGRGYHDGWLYGKRNCKQLQSY